MKKLSFIYIRGGDRSRFILKNGPGELAADGPARPGYQDTFFVQKVTNGRKIYLDFFPPQKIFDSDFLDIGESDVAVHKIQDPRENLNFHRPAGIPDDLDNGP